MQEEDIKIYKILKIILEYAIYKSASDIHFDCEEDKIIVRYRINHILQHILELEKKYLKSLARVIQFCLENKEMISELVCEGRFKFAPTGNPASIINCIVVIRKTSQGKKIVITLHNKKSQARDLRQLGIPSQTLSKIYPYLNPDATQNHAQNGTILLTSPAGEGLSTSFYSMLSYLESPFKNIASLEYLIECDLPHINQSQIEVRQGFNFQNGIRAILRQDPDMIGVAEVRNKTEMKLLLESTIDRNLTIACLSAQSTISALSLLADMELPLYLIADAINLIINQRLLRRICPHCIERTKLTKDEIKKILINYDADYLLKLMQEHNIVSKIYKDFFKLEFYRGAGCVRCGQSGYLGEIGIFEILELNDEIRKIIKTKGFTKHSIAKIIEKIDKQNNLSLIADAFMKAKNGITSIEEVLRII